MCTWDQETKEDMYMARSMRVRQIKCTQISLTKSEVHFHMYRRKVLKKGAK
jgi:hypothetical protein